jgi:putative membrane protein
MKKTGLTTTIAITVFGLSAFLAAAPLGAVDQLETEAAPPEAASTEALSKDGAFIEETARHHLLELALARMAAEKSETSDVQQFARRIFEDHRTALTELGPLAQAHGVALPKLGEEEQEKLGKLTDKTGEEFDQAFAKQMIKGHAKTIKKFEKASVEELDQKLIAYITATLPVLKQHRDKAIELGKNVGLDETTITSLTEEEAPEAVGAPAEAVQEGRDVQPEEQPTEPQTEQDEL